MFLSKLFKLYKYYTIAFIVLAIGAFLLHNLLSNYNDLEKQKTTVRLNKAHNDAIISAKAGIEVYATLVSSLKSYTKNSQQFPSEKNLQKYLNDLLKEIKFNDSILVNYIDTDHVFKYVITPSEIDPQNLKGISVKSFRPQKRINELDSLMQYTNIRLFTPINLREGWAGFPFNFSARNDENEVIGYITPILNVKYLLDYFYANNNQDTYAHKFLVNDSIDLTREAFYNGSKIYNTNRDLEYYKKFNIDESNFIYSTIELFGLKLKVGSAFKNEPKINQGFNWFAYIWYAIISLLVFMVLNQYKKNSFLNKSLKNANVELESNLLKIQTLIKEIHHRIKNNLQMVSGILLMQESEYDDKNVKKALKDSRNRIQSMSLVHEKLYGNKTLKQIKTKDYIVQLIEFVEQTIKNKSLELDKQIIANDDLIFDADTTSNLGLIINELVTNSYKYAFKEKQKNSLHIEIVEYKNGYKLIYKDSGEGLPDDFNIETSKSLGMQLITILTEQLSGRLHYTKTPESTFVIEFKPIENSFKDKI